MPNVKWTDFIKNAPSATTPFVPADLLAVVQGGETNHYPVDNISVGMFADAANASIPTAPKNLLANTTMHVYPAPAYGSSTWDSGHDVGPAINLAIVAAAAGGGGTVLLPAGSFGLSTSIVLANGVMLVGALETTGGGTSVTGTILTWIGSSGADMLLAGDASTQLFSSGFRGISFKGADTAARAIVMRGIVRCNFENNYVDGVTTTAWDLDVAFTTGVFNAPSSDNRFIANLTNLISAGAINANGWLIGPGSAANDPPASAANDTFRCLWLHDRTIYQNGVGFTGGNMDACHYLNGHVVPISAGTGRSLVLNGSNTVGLNSCRENFFEGLFGRSVSGTGPIAHGGTVQASQYNYILQNQENGAPAPVLDMPSGGVLGAILEYDTTRGLRRRADLALNNEGVTGTQQYGVVRMSAGGLATSTLTTTIDGGIGIAIGTGGTAGSAMIVSSGRVPVLYDGSVTVGHWVTYSTTVAGAAHDTGISSLTGPRPGSTIGIVQETGVGAGYYDTIIDFAGPTPSYSAMEFGNASLAANTTTFLIPGTSGTSSIQDIGQMCPIGETFDFLRVRPQNPPGIGQSITITFNTGPVGAIAATTLTCTITGTSQTGTDNTHTAAVVGGQLWNVQVTTSAGAAATGVISIGMRRKI